jgi:hypothetical protein
VIVVSAIVTVLMVSVVVVVVETVSVIGSVSHVLTSIKDCVVTDTVDTTFIAVMVEKVSVSVLVVFCS